MKGVTFDLISFFSPCLCWTDAIFCRLYYRPIKTTSQQLTPFQLVYQQFHQLRKIMWVHFKLFIGTSSIWLRKTEGQQVAEDIPFRQVGVLLLFWIISTIFSDSSKIYPEVCFCFLLRCGQNFILAPQQRRWPTAEAQILNNDWHFHLLFDRLFNLSTSRKTF